MGGERVDDAIGTDFLGVVRQDRHARLCSRLHNHHGDFVEEGRQHGPQFMQHARHRAAEHQSRDLGLLIQQASERQSHFVTGRTRVRCNSPRPHQFFPGEQTQDSVRVSDINGQQH